MPTYPLPQKQTLSPSVTLKGVTACFRGHTDPVFDGIDLHVLPGETVGLIGRSGCGKTTLLRLIAGLLPKEVAHLNGELTINGKHGWSAALQNVSTGFLFQEPTLLPWMKAWENAGIPLRIAGHKWNDIYNLVHQKFTQFGLLDRLAYPVTALSRGMQQRVAFVRAIIGKPEMLLLDEPTTGLDEFNKWMLLKIIEDYCSTTDSTTLIVTHDIESAVFLCDRIVLFAGQPATISHIETINVKRPRVSEAEHNMELSEKVSSLRSRLLQHHEF